MCRDVCFRSRWKEACGAQFHQSIWIRCFQTEKILLVSEESRSPKHCQGEPDRRDGEKGDLGKSAVRQRERDVWVLILQQNQGQSMFFLVTRKKY